MTMVYLLYHYRTGDIDESESQKFIGVFNSEQDVKNAMDILKNKRGFNEYPDGFVVAEAVVGEIGWQDGFMGTINDKEWEEWSKI